MAYTIKEIAQLANVSTRTIRYYDEIGLLPPAYIGNNGYRYYDRQSLLSLQQILFYRELDVPLKEIIRFFADPGFNPLEALMKHRNALQGKADRVQKLITTIDNTIDMIKGEKGMAENELFNGLDEKKYTDEAEARWGETDRFKKSKEQWSSYSKIQKEAIKKEGGDITTRMVGTGPDVNPDDEDVQKAIGDYVAYINKYFYPCDAAFLRGLSEMWAADARFGVNYERIREGGASFVKQAVAIYCDRNKT